MLGISDAAESIGFRTRGYRLTWEQLRDEVPLPCIVHWNQRHFVVVYKIKKRRAQSAGHRARSTEHGAHMSAVASAKVEGTEQESESPELFALSPDQIRPPLLPLSSVR